jgi:hypothetical protein
VFAASPAQAALVYKGTFTIRTDANQQCAGVQNNGTTNKTPIQLQPCTAADNQRWAVFLAGQTAGIDYYWILAYGGAYPLNQCMDRGDSPGLDHMWIYGCHGGEQQRWGLTLASGPITNVSLRPSGYCVDLKTNSTTLAIKPCSVFTASQSWTFVPA